MSLLLLLLLPFGGGVAAWTLGNRRRVLARAAMAGTLGADALLLLWLWGARSGSESSSWIAQWSASWIPQLGVRFALALDGLAFLMALLTCIVGIAALMAIWNSERANNGLHGFLYMTLLTGVLGVFLASDLLLFFVFYEVMLLPAAAMILLWGSGGREREALRFFVFTQASGMFMFIAILGLHVEHFRSTGVHSFAYADLLQTPLTESLGMLFLAGFFLAFAVKLPLVPFHTWQPGAYAAAPVEASILFSALMAKTAGYGLLRFAIPMFPEVAVRLAPLAMSLGLLTILYASWVAFGQTDLKRLIAYSSAAHLGYVVLGAFAMNEMAQRGAVVQLFCHGLSATGLFVIADLIERDTGSRDLGELGGLWHSSPRLGGLGIVFAMATLGLPGLGNFIGEFLILAGTFKTHPLFGGLAVLGAVLAAAYSLLFVQRAFFGPRVERTADAHGAQPALIVPAILAALLVIIGFFPQPLLNAARLGGGAESVWAAASDTSEGGNAP